MSDEPMTVAELAALLVRYPQHAVVQIRVVKDDEDPVPFEDLDDDLLANTVLRGRTVSFDFRGARQVDGQDRDVLRITIKHADW